MTQPSPASLTDRCHAERRVLAGRGWRLLDFDAVGVPWDEFEQRVGRRVAELLAQDSRLADDSSSRRRSPISTARSCMAPSKRMTRGS